MIDRRWTLALSLPLTALALAAPQTADAYAIKPPWRGDSVPHGVYMQTSGHKTAYDCPNGASGGCAMDIGVVRYDGGWTPWITSPSASPAPHEDFLSYGKQLYSPVDGDVIGCWRNMPNDLANGDEPPGCDTAAPKNRCAISGNHLFIRTDDGHVVYLAHLKPGSIPAALCPFTDTVLDETSSIECIETGYTGLRSDARIDKISPFPGFPRVKKGDPIAQIGASGAADDPHLHLGVYEYVADELGNPCISGVPYEFSESWSQLRPSGSDAVVADWTPLVGEELVFDDSNFTYLLWGDPVGPRVDGVGLVDGSKPALALTPSGGVAAYLNTSNQLEAVGFNFDVNDDFDLGLADTDLAVLDLDIAPISTTDRHAVAAVIDSATTKLTIVPYFVKTDADLIVGTKRVESTPGAQLVRATRSPVHNGIVVAIKNSSDGVSVVNYKTALSGTTLSVTRESSDATADTINDLDIATVVAGRGVSETTGAFKGVVTAERRSDNTVWLQSWQLNSTGTTLTQIDEEQVKNGASSFTVSDVDVTVTGSLGGREFIVVSSTLTTSGNLRVQSWQISTTGQLSRVEQYDETGSFSRLASTRTGLQDAAVGMRVGTSSQTVVSFHVTSEGVLRRVGTWDAEDLGGLALAGRSAEEDLVALFPDPSSSDLLLTHHVTNYQWSL